MYDEPTRVTRLVTPYKTELNTPLISFRDSNGQTDWCYSDAFEGLSIWGANGSGKTSGIARQFALKFLEHFWGGTVLTCKPEEADLWRQYCNYSGRLPDLIVVEPGSGHCFNFLDYICNSKESTKGIVQNIVDVIKTVIHANDNGGQGSGNDEFWSSSLDQLLHNAVSLNLLAHGTVTVQDLYDIISHAPAKGDTKPNMFFKNMIELAQQNVDTEVFHYIDELSIAEKERLKNPTVFSSEILKKVPAARKLKFIDTFFFEHYKNLADKTRSIITFSVTNLLFQLLQDPMFSLFCGGKTTFSPEDTYLRRKIIVMNIPVKVYENAGRSCQILWKYCYQLSVEKRDINKNSRGLFLFQDEAQFFVVPHDALFQATARSSRVASVYISQNLNSYHSNMGGDKSESLVMALHGCLGTKVFAANTCVKTNEWASSLIGQAWTEDTNHSDTVSDTFSWSTGKSYKLERVVRPEQFNLLKSGGIRNNFEVEAYVHLQGRCFHSGFNHRKVIFLQKDNIHQKMKQL